MGYSRSIRQYPDPLIQEGGPFYGLISNWAIVNTNPIRGNYTTLAAALAATEPYIFVTSNIGETDLVVTENTQIFYAAYVQHINFSPGHTLFTVNGGGVGKAVGIQAVGGNAFLLQFGTVISVVGAGDSLTLRNIAIQSAAGNCVQFSAASQSFSINRCEIGNGSAIGLLVPAAMAAPTRAIYTAFEGATDGAQSTAAWANAPFYHCQFEGGRTNIAFAAGNTSNVDL